MDPMGNEAVLSWAMLGLMLSVGSAILIPLIGQDSKPAEPIPWLGLCWSDSCSLWCKSTTKKPLFDLGNSLRKKALFLI